MSSFDDLFQHENEQLESWNNQFFDKEAWKKHKQEQQEMVYSMIDSTAQTIARDGVASGMLLPISMEHCKLLGLHYWYCFCHWCS